MKAIRIIWKSYNLYTLPITIIEMEKSNEITKIHLYNDIIDLNNIIIKDARYISCQ